MTSVMFASWSAAQLRCPRNLRSNYSKCYPMLRLDKAMVKSLFTVNFHAQAHEEYVAGMTETSTTVCMFPWHQRLGTLGSAGQFAPGIRARVVKEDGSLATYGEQGELVVTGPSMALGYTNNAVAYVVPSHQKSPANKSLL